MLSAQHIFMRVFGFLGPEQLILFLCTIILAELLRRFYFNRLKKQEGRRPSLAFTFGVYVFLFYLMLVYSQTGITGFIHWGSAGPVIRPDRIYLIPFSSSPDLVPYVLNVLMTIPLGFLLPLLWPSFRSLPKVALTGFFFSLGIEGAQLFLIRASTVDDLWTNTLGAIIGFLGWKLLSKLLPSKQRQRGTASNKVKYEGLAYLIASFIGATVLFHPGLRTWLPSSQPQGIFSESFTDSGTFSKILLGTVTAMDEEGLWLDVTDIDRQADGSEIAVFDGIGHEADWVRIGFLPDSQIELVEVDPQTGAQTANEAVPASAINLGNLINTEVRTTGYGYKAKTIAIIEAR